MEFDLMRITNSQFAPPSFPGNFAPIGAMACPTIALPSALTVVRWDWQSPTTAAVFLLQAHLLGIIPGDADGFNAIMDKFLKAIAEERAASFGVPAHGLSFSDGGLTISIGTFNLNTKTVHLSVAIDHQSLAQLPLGALYQPSAARLFGPSGMKPEDDDSTLGQDATFLHLAQSLVTTGGIYAADKTTYGLRVPPAEVQPGQPNVIATVKLCGEDGESIDTALVPFYAPNLAIAATTVPTCGVAAEALRLGVEYDDFVIEGVRYMTAEERQQYAVKSE